MGRSYNRGKFTKTGKIIFTLIISLFLLCTFQPPANAINIAVGDDAPDFILNAINSDIISLSDYKEKVLVLIYWRPGQERSYLALEDGKYIYDNFKEKNVMVLGLIAGTDNPDEVKKITNEHNINFPILLDSYRDVYSDYGIRVYPSTIIVDKYGKIAQGIPGHALTYRLNIEAYIKYLLGEINRETLYAMISPKRATKNDTLLKAERTYNLALQFSEANLIDKAIEASMKSIESDPDNAQSYNLLGFLFLNKNEADKAHQQFTKALSINSGSNDAKTGLGASLILKGDINGAIQILTEVAVANPYSVMTYYELGKAYGLQGDNEKSAEMYKKALDKIIKNKVLPFSAAE